jgi:C-terminal processing protease CtpA/Prc
VQTYGCAGARGAQVAPGSEADDDGTLQPGDRLVAADGLSLRGLGPDRVQQLLRGSTSGFVLLSYVRRGAPEGQHKTLRLSHNSRVDIA